MSIAFKKNSFLEVGIFSILSQILIRIRIKMELIVRILVLLKGGAMSLGRSEYGRLGLGEGAQDATVSFR